MTTSHCKCKPEFSVSGVCQACEGTKIKNPNREKTLSSNLRRRIPTRDEYLAFGGAHCGNLYTQVGSHWRCPSCHRTRYELLRWTMLYPNKPSRREGWAVGLHTHHDHQTDSYVTKPGPGQPRRLASFAPEIICEQCNSADGTVKRRLGLPDYFTYSPVEIGQFVVPTPHGKHIIRYDVAQILFERVTTRGPLFFGG